MVVGLSTLRTGHFTTGNEPGTHFCWRLGRPQDHSAIGRILCQWKIPMTPAGIEPVTSRFVVQHIIQSATMIPLSSMVKEINLIVPNNLKTMLCFTCSISSAKTGITSLKHQYRQNQNKISYKTMWARPFTTAVRYIFPWSNSQTRV